jgi:MFS family permease
LRAFLPAMLTLCLVGWGGLAIVVTQTEPTVWPRWLFFAFLFLALSGSALPVTWFLNLRFPSTPPLSPTVIVREATWVGVYGTTLAWLQLGRLVSLGVILGLAAGLIATEYFIQLRERSRWRPPAPSEETPPVPPPEAPAPPPGAVG